MNSEKSVRGKEKAVFDFPKQRGENYGKLQSNWHLRQRHIGTKENERENNHEKDGRSERNQEEVVRAIYHHIAY